MAKKKFKELIKDLVFNNPRADREFPLDGDDPDIDKKMFYDANRQRKSLEKIRQKSKDRFNRTTEVET